MGNESGYVYAYRRSWTNDVFKDLREAAVWNFLYQNAFYKDGIRCFNGVTFHLKRGQIVISTSFLANGFHMSKKEIESLFRRLIQVNMISMKSRNKGTIITIINYEKYQENKNKGGNKTESERNQGGSKRETETIDDIDLEVDFGKQKGNKRYNKRETKGNNNNKGIKELKNIYNISDDTWNDFVQLRNKKKAPVTKTAIDRIKKQADKAGWTLEDAMQEMCSRGWAGFNAEWVTSKKQKEPAGKPWEAAIEMWKRSGNWPTWAGVEPGMSGCEVPKELLKKYNIR